MQTATAKRRLPKGSSIHRRPDAHADARRATPDAHADADAGAHARRPRRRPHRRQARSQGAVSGPVTITAGGTYSGTYESRDPSKPAVTIATTQPVVLDGAVIRHTGNGVFAQSTRANLTVKNSRFVALAPASGIVEQLDVYAYQPTAFVVEHNSFTNGHGVLAGGNNLLTSPFSVSFNDFVNIGRYNANSADRRHPHRPGPRSWRHHPVEPRHQHLRPVRHRRTRSASTRPTAPPAIPSTSPTTSSTATTPTAATGRASPVARSTSVTPAGRGWTVTTTRRSTSPTSATGSSLGTTSSSGTRWRCTTGAPGSPTVGRSCPRPSATAPRPGRTRRTRRRGNVTISGNRAGHLRYNGGRWERADYYLPVGGLRGQHQPRHRERRRGAGRR